MSEMGPANVQFSAFNDVPCALSLGLGALSCLLFAAAQLRSDTSVIVVVISRHILG